MIPPRFNVDLTNARDKWRNESYTFFTICLVIAGCVFWSWVAYCLGYKP